MTDDSKINGRTHEPSLRELTSQLDDLKVLMNEKFSGMKLVQDERHGLYKERSEAADKAIAAALSAQKEMTAAAFAASKEAIVKAENSQNSYNISHNDLIRKQELMMPRPEVDRIVVSWDEKFNDVKKEISGLRESRSANVGAALQRTEVHQTNQWVIGLVIGAILAVMQIALRMAGK